MAEAANAVRFVTINANHEGQRIDNFLITFLKGAPKSLIYRIIRKGEIRVNKKRVKAVYRLCIGDEVRVPPIRLAEKAEEIPVSANFAQVLESCVLRETEDWLVLNKPQGLSVHAGSGVQQGLIEALRQIRPEEAFLELVHRLDKDTSGCILIAKNRLSLNQLQDSLKKKQFSKRYHALVGGRWPARTEQVNQPLKKIGIGNAERVVKVDEAEGKASLTRFKVLERFKGCTLMEAEPVTGRTHQIRVHAQWAGHPLIGDVKYGDEAADAGFRQLGFKRLFLHAASLGFPDPVTGEQVTVKAPYDSALSEIMQKLKRGEAQ
ncbi:ribosomal large subunit pseudouridine synthase C [Oceanospirillum multiglobuliferum]|uniref:23S rRNA pseudouridine(955/2504/2580) synthase RluC n=1 Tax=Oceanospirillum multiglobuliferum TaxID=64969 RepID=UPI0009D4F6F5|nr:23S rRNA pseudouridine(955/2504/2580) synthase RluC [Oceanospirillum multiglobuliferum]SKA10503.1 ribosomal large subunit pseudouridine synthase C [Oceanospirillum multiglobuliferum]